ncbi:CbiX/SirB N-terminal domain-containing protein [Saccharolobus islandicus]|uniref:Sirohydrochlorin cobaltochelatase n=6 Tax=Saccharolobus islandicus TaxID=43080 RepID=CBIX_SACI1|nr:CbiX/SirB N-terminal domain-containing protein [Sulfolobus islandicus]C3MR05.1 RecName: Full=Sirohydrochlorin cobaltochelatase; AltName: Full=CbiXS [Sulfolobus islandicus L.S.2.15]C3MWZ3.1 RecName: Full=Sirohydrochlorin cobaltochelatase; AltName: Full=CbiXS [Sulfolobus islandicus M.14.25]C3MZ53.1 RecName: Full=Sirohydrochlorin cobaltochelatase; AltName: Full=CbiXS [Sulfolobus islandicus M.16.27]C3NGG2.1 RecName: Full=Sirohydrochlorin cobaltochelatase; AltName: Full=CbiXS [Sulfolobus islandic
MLGVLLVLHGSKIPEWKDVGIKYAEYLSRYFNLVEFGFLEFNKPTLSEALSNLLAKGANKIVVVPLLFATGTHFKRDIPRLLGIDGDEKKIQYMGKEIEIIIADPLGFDEKIGEVLVKRVNETYNKNY